jgi:hypothetical protein
MEARLPVYPRAYAPPAWLAAVEPAIAAAARRATFKLAGRARRRGGVARHVAGGPRRDDQAREPPHASQDRDGTLGSARVPLVNRDVDGRLRWAPVRLAALLVAFLDQRLLDKLVAADPPGPRRRRQAGR